ncbi:hypothetical protein P5673_008416, partial [Acropora cervicornis]
MRLYKAWDTRRRKRKAVAARRFQEFVIGGKPFNPTVLGCSQTPKGHFREWTSLTEGSQLADHEELSHE